MTQAPSSPYVDPITRRVMSAWAGREPERAPVFTPRDRGSRRRIGLVPGCGWVEEGRIISEDAGRRTVR